MTAPTKARSSAPPAWETRTLGLLDRQRPVLALEVLQRQQARAPASLTGPAAARVLAACLAAGFGPAARLLLDAGAFPPARSLRHCRQVLLGRMALSQAAPALGGTDAAYALPSGQPAPPLDATGLAGVLDTLFEGGCSPSEWLRAWETNRALAARLLERGLVRPWADRPALRAAAAVVIQEAERHAGRQRFLPALMARLPPGFEQGVPKLMGYLGRQFARQSPWGFSALARPDPGSWEAVILSLLALPGVDQEACASAWFSAAGEELPVLYLRANAPGVLQALIDAGPIPWAVKGNLRPRDFRSSLLPLLVDRIELCVDRPTKEAWWTLTEHLALHPESPDPVLSKLKTDPWTDPADLARWSALAKAVHLQRGLPEPQARKPSAPVMRQRM